MHPSTCRLSPGCQRIRRWTPRLAQRSGPWRWGCLASSAQANSWRPCARVRARGVAGVCANATVPASGYVGFGETGVAPACRNWLESWCFGRTGAVWVSRAAAGGGAGRCGFQPAVGHAYAAAQQDTRGPPRSKTPRHATRQGATQHNRGHNPPVLPPTYPSGSRGQSSPLKSATASSIPARRIRTRARKASPAARAMPRPRTSADSPIKIMAMAARVGTSSVNA